MRLKNNQLSLKKELLRKRTILSFGLSLFLIYLFFSRAALADIIKHAGKANPLFLLLSLVFHYLSYFFRGLRWQQMIRHTGFSGKALDLSKIIFLFQSVDCVLPAKLGDLYGAQLMKLNFGISRSFALGSIFMWRFFDFIFVVAAVLVTGLMVFGHRLPPELMGAVKVTLPIILVLVAVVLLLSRYHHRLYAIFRSDKIRELIDLFRQGIQINWKNVPLITLSTAIIWSLEGARFYFVCKAMAVDINIWSVLFVMFFATLLTAVPFTPSGLGAVELGMLKLLSLTHIESTVAYSIIIWDRLIAHWSQIVFGILFVCFHRSANLKVWHEDGQDQSANGEAGDPKV